MTLMMTTIYHFHGFRAISSKRNHSIRMDWLKSSAFPIASFPRKFQHVNETVYRCSSDRWICARWTTLTWDTRGHKMVSLDSGPKNVLCELNAVIRRSDELAPVVMLPPENKMSFIFKTNRCSCTGAFEFLIKREHNGQPHSHTFMRSTDAQRVRHQRPRPRPRPRMPAVITVMMTVSTVDLLSQRAIFASKIHSDASLWEIAK